jgi:hypothetical protein
MPSINSRIAATQTFIADPLKNRSKLDAEVRFGANGTMRFAFAKRLHTSGEEIDLLS